MLSKICDTCGAEVLFAPAELGQVRNCERCGELLRLTDPSATTRTPPPVVSKKPKPGQVSTAVGSLVALGVFFACCGICSGIPTMDQPNADPATVQFSAWDGSHAGVVESVKSQMHDPRSFEHVETIYWDMNTRIKVQMTFRGKNGFGGTVTQVATAWISKDTGRVDHLICD